VFSTKVIPKIAGLRWRNFLKNIHFTTYKGKPAPYKKERFLLFFNLPIIHTLKLHIYSMHILLLILQFTTFPYISDGKKSLIGFNMAVKDV
jgi:hypothetical protein